MNEESAKKLADEICDICGIDNDDTETFYDILDIIIKIPPDPDLLEALKTIAGCKGPFSGADASCFLQIAQRAIYKAT